MDSEIRLVADGSHYGSNAEHLDSSVTKCWWKQMQASPARGSNYLEDHAKVTPLHQACLVACDPTMRRGGHGVLQRVTVVLKIFAAERGDGAWSGSVYRGTSKAPFLFVKLQDTRRNEQHYVLSVPDAGRP